MSMENMVMPMRAPAARPGNRDWAEEARAENVVTIPAEAPLDDAPLHIVMEPRASSRPELVAFARGMLASRRCRERLLSDFDFGEPTWDILLETFVAAGEGRKVSVSSLCIGAAVPTSTALRHITHLINAGHLRRVRDEVDGRRSFIEPSDEVLPRLMMCLDRMMNRVGPAFTHTPER